VTRAILLVAAIGLAACDTQVPDSGAGVGFSDYAQYELERAQREASLGGSAVTGPAGGTVPAPEGISQSELAAAGIGTADPGRTQGVQAQPGNPEPVVLNNPGISDEQDFGAVADRETIESDAQRRAAQAAAYEVIAPTAVPTRSGGAGPNIVAFALQTTNLKGQAVYTRAGIAGQSRFQRNCAKYTSPDEAQRDFLSRGGPERDPRGIDPDGDGFACAWDPAPYRTARQAAAGN
jgi:hypothetical protein